MTDLRHQDISRKSSYSNSPPWNVKYFCICEHLRPYLTSVVCVLWYSALFASLAQQSNAPTFGGLAQGGTFGSPQPTGGFGAFGSTAGK